MSVLLRAAEHAVIWYEHSLRYERKASASHLSSEEQTRLRELASFAQAVADDYAKFAGGNPVIDEAFKKLREHNREWPSK